MYEKRFARVKQYRLNELVEKLSDGDVERLRGLWIGFWRRSGRLVLFE